MSGRPAGGKKVDRTGALERAVAAAKGVPRASFGVFPTPVEPLDVKRVVPAFAGGAWVKREDRSAPDLGGNKVRKLEFLLAEAAARGCGAVVSVGGIGSNHALATAFYAPECGLDAHLVIFPHHVTPGSRRVLRAIASLGAHVTYCPAGNATPLVMASVYARLRAGRRAPYLIPPGGCSVTGTLGFVDAGLELAGQVADGLLDPPDAIFCAYGSGSSAAGLAVGLQMGGLYCRVIAVRVYDRFATTQAWVRLLARRVSRRLVSLDAGLARVDASVISVESRYLGGGYAEPTAQSSAAREAASDLGLHLDGTYTSKAFAAFLDAAGSHLRGSRLVFLQSYDSRVPPELDDSDAVGRLPAPLRRFT